MRRLPRLLLNPPKAGCRTARTPAWAGTSPMRKALLNHCPASARCIPPKKGESG